jgi:hypothetical protein
VAAPEQRDGEHQGEPEDRTPGEVPECGVGQSGQVCPGQHRADLGGQVEQIVDAGRLLAAQPEHVLDQEVLVLDGGGE